MRWEYGVTTHHSRIATTLPRTLESLARGGFSEPRLFVDGPIRSLPTWLRHYRLHLRETPVFAFGNWSLALYEMVTISPDCDRYMLVQDDVLMCRNVCQYLEQVPLQPKTYLNLISWRGNGPSFKEQQEGFTGFYKTPRNGKGAQALVFDREGVRDLLLTGRFFDHRLNLTTDSIGVRGRKNIDGVVCDSMKDRGYAEMAHWPSLVTHLHEEPSAIGNRRQDPVESFPGADWDARVLLRKSS